jgi:hypothetical protein
MNITTYTVTIFSGSARSSLSGKTPPPPMGTPTGTPTGTSTLHIDVDLQSRYVLMINLS